MFKMTTWISFFPALLFSLFASGQELANVIPNLPIAPEAASVLSVNEVPVGQYSGTFNNSIPLTGLSYRGVDVPVSISYNSGGIRVEEEASSIGLGWALNAGGVISRSIRGGDDFGVGGRLDNTGFTGYYTLMESGGFIPEGPVEYAWLNSHQGALRSIFRNIISVYPEQVATDRLLDEFIYYYFNRELSSDLFVSSSHLSNIVQDINDLSHCQIPFDYTFLDVESCFETMVELQMILDARTAIARFLASTRGWAHHNSSGNRVSVLSGCSTVENCLFEGQDLPTDNTQNLCPVGQYDYESD